MDLSYGSAMEEFRSEVSDFLADNWPPTGDEAKYSQADQATRFRKRAIDRGFLCRNIPKKYGGSEQPTDVLKGQVIREEFERTRRLVLELRRSDELLDREPVIQRSIRLRNPYVDPMSLLQVDLLRRWRATSREDAGLEQAIFTTIKGIARGLQNTG